MLFRYTYDLGLGREGEEGLWSINCLTAWMAVPVFLCNDAARDVVHYTCDFGCGRGRWGGGVGGGAVVYQRSEVEGRKAEGRGGVMGRLWSTNIENCSGFVLTQLDCIAACDIHCLSCWRA